MFIYTVNVGKIELLFSATHSGTMFYFFCYLLITYSHSHVWPPSLLEPRFSFVIC